MRALIATERADAAIAAETLAALRDMSSIVVVGAYRIPFHGLHAMTRATRLERELAIRTHEELQAFVRTAALPAARIQLVVERGDLDEVVLRAVRVHAPDLVVIADRGRRGITGREALVALGPW